MDKKHYHFIGIAGIGMSALAKLLLENGERVSGSDPGSSVLTDELSRAGVRIFKDHHKDNIKGADFIVYSSAIRKTNQERIEAIEKGIPVLRRGELLAKLFNNKQGIAVAGSHGKTTTSSLLATVLRETGAMPTAAVGGIISHLGTNAFSGKGDLFVAESDESDGSFLLLSPAHAILTNIDNDHMDHYGTVAELTGAFERFLTQVRSGGKILVNADDPGIQRAAGLIGTHLSFGIKAGDYLGHDLKCSADGSTFNVTTPSHETHTFFLPHLGRHNVYNALGVIALCIELGFKAAAIQQGLSVFRGVGRRLEKIFSHDNFTLLDDYGHHPTEIKTTIQSIKEVDPRPLVIIFEPHRYSRTQNFWQDFTECFSGADKVYISPIYAASEDAIDGISSEALVDAQKRLGLNVELLPDLSGMREIKNNLLVTECILLTLGAGGISKKIREIIHQDHAPVGAS